MDHNLKNFTKWFGFFLYFCFSNSVRIEEAYDLCMKVLIGIYNRRSVLPQTSPSEL